MYRSRVQQVPYTIQSTTTRLNSCLLFNRYDAELTACYRSYLTEISWRKRVPKDIDSNCLLFQGAPEKLTNEGIITMDSKQPQDKEDEGYSSPCSMSSVENGRFPSEERISLRQQKTTDKICSHHLFYPIQWKRPILKSKKSGLA